GLPGSGGEWSVSSSERSVTILPRCSVKPATIDATPGTDSIRWISATSPTWSSGSACRRRPVGKWRMRAVVKVPLIHLEDRHEVLEMIGGPGQGRRGGRHVVHRGGLLLDRGGGLLRSRGVS